MTIAVSRSSHSLFMFGTVLYERFALLACVVYGRCEVHQRGFIGCFPSLQRADGAGERWFHTLERWLNGAGRGVGRAGVARGTGPAPAKVVRQPQQRAAAAPVYVAPPAPVDDTVRLSFPHRSKDAARAALKVGPSRFLVPRFSAPTRTSD